MEISKVAWSVDGEPICARAYTCDAKGAISICRCPILITLPGLREIRCIIRKNNRAPTHGVPGRECDFPCNCASLATCDITSDTQCVIERLIPCDIGILKSIIPQCRTV